MHKCVENYRLSFFGVLWAQRKTIKRLSKQPERYPAGVRRINSDLIGFTYKMKKIKAEVDTT